MVSSPVSPSIFIKDLSKRYAGADELALNKLSLSVHQGEVYGVLGPNGAGKTTAIRLLMNFIQPTNGKVTILGHDIVSESVKVKGSIGYLSGELAIYPKLTGKQFLAYMNGLQPARSQAYIQELAKRLRADLNKQLAELSRGNRQKIGLIAAFMHDPKVLILDEPTSGLDPLMQEVFYQLLREVKKRGTSVFISSHILSEVQKMCDRVGFIREGRLVSESSINQMTAQAAQMFEILFVGAPPLSDLKKTKGVRIVSHQGDSVSIHVHGKLAPLFAVLAKHNVLKIQAHNLDLEEVFLRFYKGKGIKL